MPAAPPPRRDFISAGPRDRILPGAARLVRAMGTAIAVFDVGGRVLAIDDLCARCGASLAEARQDGAIATCRRCGWRYDLATGSVVGLPALRLDRFAVRIEGGEVLVATRPFVDP